MLQSDLCDVIQKACEELNQGLQSTGAFFFLQGNVHSFIRSKPQNYFIRNYKEKNPTTIIFESENLLITKAA